MNLQEKEQAVGELSEGLKNIELGILVSYQGCTCQELTNLRRSLKKCDAKFSVVKNSLVRLAVKGTAAEKFGDFLAGPVAMIWAYKDPVSPAKVVKEFAKDNEKFSVKAGVLGDSFLDASGVESLASLPSREQLLSKLLALINAPATRLLQTINEPASQLARLMGAWRDELEKKGK